MYKDPKSFIYRYLEKYKEDIKDFKVFKSEIEMRLMDSEVTERERLETQYFLYYLEKNMKRKLFWQGTARASESLTSSPVKSTVIRQSITPEKRKSANNIVAQNVVNSNKNSVSMSRADYGSYNLAEIKQPSVFHSQPLSDFTEFSIKNTKNEILPQEINLSYRTDNSSPSPTKNSILSPSKHSEKSFQTNKEKLSSIQNDSNFPTDEANTSINSVPSQQIQKLRKISIKKPSKKEKTESLPKIQLKKYAFHKKEKFSKPKNSLDHKTPLIDQNQSLLNKQKIKLIRKKGPCNHIHHYSPITKLSILDSHHKGLIQSSSIPVIDESKKLDLIMRSVSLEKQKNFKNFQLVKLFNF